MIELFGKLSIINWNDKKIEVDKYDKINMASSNIPHQTNASSLLDIINKKEIVMVGENLSYYVGKEISNEQGIFNTPYEIEVFTSSSPSKFKIAFDDKNNIYPQEIKITELNATIKGQSGTLVEHEEIFYFPFEDFTNEENIMFINWEGKAVDVNYYLTSEHNPPIIIPVYTSSGDYFKFDRLHAYDNLKDYFLFTYDKFQRALEEGYYEDHIGRIAYIEGDSPYFYVVLNFSFEHAYIYTIREWSEIIGATPDRVVNILGNNILSQKVNSPIAILSGLDEYSYAEAGKEYKYSSVKLKIEKINAKNTPLTVSGIYFNVDDEIYTINRKNIISIESSIMDRSDLKTPSFGVISNNGFVEVTDYDGKLLTQINNGILSSGNKIEIFLRNTLVENAIQKIGEFETESFDYDNDNRSVRINVKDDLEEWQEINVDGVIFDPRDLTSKPFSFFYNYLWKITSNRNYNSEIGSGNYNMLALGELDEKTKNILKNTYTQYPILNSGNLWQQWTKLCQACQLHIYKNSDGVIVCRYNGGN